MARWYASLASSLLPCSFRDHAQIVVSFRVIGFNRQDLFIGRTGLVQFSFFPQDVAQVPQRFDVIALERESLSIGPFSLV